MCGLFSLVLCRSEMSSSSDHGEQCKPCHGKFDLHICLRHVIERGAALPQRSSHAEGMTIQGSPQQKASTCVRFFEGYPAEEVMDWFGGAAVRASIFYINPFASEIGSAIALLSAGVG